MKVVVQQPGVVQLGRHHGNGPGEFSADARSLRLGPLRQPPLDELVERNRVGNRRRDQIILEQEFAFPLLPERDGSDRRHADRSQLHRSLAFISPLAAANPLPQHGAPIWDQEMFDVDRRLGKPDAVHDAMRPRLDGRQ